MPATATSRPHRQLCGDGRDPADEQDAEGLGQGIGQVVPGEDRGPGPGSGRRRTGRRCARCRRCPARSTASMNRNTNGHTLWAVSMNGTVHEKISSVTAATTLRLPRSAHTATGRPQRDLGHAADEGHRAEAGVAQVERPLDVGGQRADGVREGAGISAASVSRTRGATPYFCSTPHRRRRLARRRCPARARGRPPPRGRGCWLTASTSSSSGTVKSKSGACRAALAPARARWIAGEHLPRGHGPKYLTLVSGRVVGAGAGRVEQGAGELVGGLGQLA